MPPRLLPLLLIALAGAFPTPASAQTGDTPAGPSVVAPSPEATAPPTLPETIEPRPVAELPRVGDYHRAALHVDPIEALIARGRWKDPEPGEAVLDAAGRKTPWRAPSEAPSADLAGGYLYAKFDSPAAGVMVVDATGCAAVCVNGDWLPGDPYALGWFRLPVEVVQGENWVLAHRANPTALPRLSRTEKPVEFLPQAAVLPDLVAGAAEPLSVAIPLRNASSQPLQRARLRWSWDGGDEPVTTPLRRIDPLLLTPVTLEVAAPRGKLEPGVKRRLRVEVLPETSDAPLAATTLELSVVSPESSRTDTFVSAIDGSVQPYGILPPQGEAASAGVVVTLHDAGETFRERLAKHAPSESHVLAPGGRGAWGFDWEDWSARDAIEALDDFLARQAARGKAADPRRVSLLGEGMGGHGALRLATLNPQRFSAVGVIDGWISFYTQGGARTAPADASPVAALLGRQPSANDPLRVIENLRGLPVSVRSRGALGPGPTEARFLRERLGAFHDDFVYRETPAPSDAALLGEQIDWLVTRRRPDPGGLAEEVDFATPNPGASATSDGVTILAPRRHGEVARVRLTRDPKRSTVRGETINVRRLTVDFAAWRDRGAVTLELDGSRPVRFTPGRDGDVLSLARDREGEWRRIPDGNPAPGLFKAPPRVSGFKTAFAARPQLVYGTRGNDDERRWAAAKARYDAHLFYYRGAGLLEVLPDRELRAAMESAPSVRRSVVLYGSAPTNAAWVVLEQESFFRRRRMLRVEDGVAWLGERPERGDDLAVLAVRPRLGDEAACVAVVGGTGVVGMRMTTRLRYFWSGVEYPDYLLMGPEALDSPTDLKSARDVRAAGYFDSDWGVDEGGILWRDLAM